ncbi:universal stress protein [Streptomyces sp. MS06]|uniref:universal stress protein n=1 Tax=Streptomyces sp. MS06 TaxID=3385974 RepID=UPI0039A3F752
MTLQHVAVGVDGSLNAVRALDRAADEAALRGAELRVLYAVPDADEAAPVLASAEARVRERHPGLPLLTVPVEGGAVPALARESARAVLTVVGTRGHGTLTGLLAGSVSARLAARARGPLLVVRGDHPCDGAQPVLLGLESDADADAAARAFEEAELRGAPLRVLHASTHRHLTPELPSPLPATSPGQRHQAREEQAEEDVPRFALTRLREAHPGVAVDARTVRTAPAHALPEATRQAGLVVVGAPRRTGAPSPVVHALLHGSHCPVLLVPAAG